MESGLYPPPPTPSFLCLLQLLTPFRLKTAHSPPAPLLHIPHSNHTSLFSWTLHQSLCSFTVFFKLFRFYPSSISQTWRAAGTAHKLKSLWSYFNQKHISPTIPLNSGLCISHRVTNALLILKYETLAVILATSAALTATVPKNKSLWHLILWEDTDTNLEKSLSESQNIPLTSNKLSQAIYWHLFSCKLSDTKLNGFLFWDW